MAAAASSPPSGAAPEKSSLSLGSGSTDSTAGCFARNPTSGGATCATVTP